MAIGEGRGIVSMDNFFLFSTTMLWIFAVAKTWRISQLESRIKKLERDSEDYWQREIDRLGITEEDLERAAKISRERWEQGLSRDYK